jgi:hypothetical protein
MSVSRIAQRVVRPSVSCGQSRTRRVQNRSYLARAVRQPCGVDRAFSAARLGAGDDGYSDIAAFSCAIHARTGLVTYSGPHYSTFGTRDHFEQTQRWFDAAVRSQPPVAVEVARTWTDDCWYLDQDARHYRPNDGHWVLAEGRAEGRLVGGNLSTLNLLHGTRDPGHCQCRLWAY